MSGLLSDLDNQALFETVSAEELLAIVGEGGELIAYFSQHGKQTILVTFENKTYKTTSPKLLLCLEDDTIEGLSIH